MDFSKLNQNEKLAVYGAIASVVGPILASMGFGFGAGFLTLLLALAMLAIVFLPQISPTTSLPGSKGSLMLIVGGIAAASAALSLLGSIAWLGFFGTNLVFVLGWLVGIAGGLLMGWAGWQEFQAEGGQFKLGTSSGSASGAPPADRSGDVDAADRRTSEAPSGEPSGHHSTEPDPAAHEHSAHEPTTPGPSTREPGSAEPLPDEERPPA